MHDKEVVQIALKVLHIIMSSTQNERITQNAIKMLFVNERPKD